MPSTSHSRRRVLAAAGGALAAALAGCTGDDEPSDPLGGDPPDDALTDPETVTVRHDDPREFATPAGDSRHGALAFLMDPAHVEGLSFRAEPPGTDDLRSFLAATDFGRSSVVLLQGRVEECYRRRIEYVVAREGEFHVDLCGELRSADVACEAGVEDMALTAIRLSIAYDEAPSRIGMGYASDCPRSMTAGRPPAGGDG